MPSDLQGECADYIEQEAFRHNNMLSVMQNEHSVVFQGAVPLEEAMQLIVFKAN